MKLIQLTMVVGPRGQASVAEESGEDDGLEATITQATEPTTPVMVDAEKVRNFYPRKPSRDGSPRTGTRLTFDNGAGMAVTETFEEVSAKFGRAN